MVTGTVPLIGVIEIRPENGTKEWISLRKAFGGYIATAMAPPSQ